MRALYRMAGVRNERGDQTGSSSAGVPVTIMRDRECACLAGACTFARHRLRLPRPHCGFLLWGSAAMRAAASAAALHVPPLPPQRRWRVEGNRRTYPVVPPPSASRGLDLLHHRVLELLHRVVGVLQRVVGVPTLDANPSTPPGMVGAGNRWPGCLP